MDTLNQYWYQNMQNSLNQKTQVCSENKSYRLGPAVTKYLKQDYMLPWLTLYEQDQCKVLQDLSFSIIHNIQFENNCL